MADVRKLLARLNPANIRYDVGRGGLPELTPVDIAGALAFVPAGLGREVLCALWWPDGAALSPEALEDAVAKKVRAEMDVRHRKLQIARMDLHIAQEAACAGRGQVTDWNRRELARLESAVAAAKARCWPWNPEMHIRIRRAVMDEVAHPNRCAKCGGRGDVKADELLVRCSECDGRGVVPVSDRSRAAKIGKHESTYRRVWADLYNWLYVQVADAEAQAAFALRQALTDGCGIDHAALCRVG